MYLVPNVFTELFHKDFSSLLTVNYNWFTHTVWFKHVLLRSTSRQKLVPISTLQWKFLIDVFRCTYAVLEMASRPLARDV